MKVLIVLIGLVAYATCADHCYNNVIEECDNNQGSGVLDKCDSKYGAIDDIVKDLQKYANSHISRSFEYLLMSTHFGNFEKSRAGFEKLYRQLSDNSWSDAIDLIKHMTKRGGKMDFNQHKASMKTSGSFEVDELSSLARALDSQKELAVDAHEIHAEVTRRRSGFHDPEVASFLEEKFVHKQADTIRELSGHSNDLKRLLNDNKDISLSLFLFDEYLQKA